MKQTEIKIPKGCKATMYQDEDKIVIEYEEQFKRGDFIALHYPYKSTISLLCLDDMDGYGNYRSIFGISESGLFATKNTFFIENVLRVRLMTESEKQKVIDRLRETGKDWDSERMEIVDWVWRPKYGDPYYTPDVYEEDLYSQGTYYGDDDDLLVFNRGLGCKTEEEAIKRAKQMLGIK